MDPQDPTSPAAESPLESPATPTSRQLPIDLPTSLDDRRPLSNYGGETEMYDGWQGKD